MSDISAGVIGGKIDSAIDFTIGKNNTPVVNFWLSGKWGRIRCIALYELAEVISRDYKSGDNLVVSYTLRLDKFLKTSGEWDEHFELLLREIGTNINLITLTGGIKDAPKEVNGKSGRQWSVFKLAVGAQRDKKMLKGDPLVISCWAKLINLGNFIIKHFTLGSQPTVFGTLNVKDGVAHVFIKHINVWFNALHRHNNTSEPGDDEKIPVSNRRF